MTTTINIANIKVGMDVSELRKGGGFARGELASLTKMFKDAETGTQRFERDLELLQRAFVSSGGAIKNYEQIVDMLETKHGLAAQSAKELAAEEAKLAHTMRAAGLGIKDNAALFSSQQLDKLAKMTEAALTPLQKFRREKEFLDNLVAKGNLDLEKYNSIIGSLRKNLFADVSKRRDELDAKNVRFDLLGVTRDRYKFTDEDLAKLEKMSRSAISPVDQLRQNVALLDKALASGMSQDAYNAILKHLIDSSGIYAQQTKKAAEEQSRLNALIESVRTPFEKYSEELKYVNEQHAAGKIDAMQHAAAVQNLAKRYGEFHPVLAATAAKIPTGKMGLFSNDELKALGQFDVPSAKPSAGSIEFLQQNMALVKAFKSGAYTAEQYDAALVDLHKRFGILALTEEDLMSKEEKLARLKREAIANTQNLSAQTQATGMSLNGLALRFVGLNEVVQLAKRGVREFTNYLKDSVQIAAKIQTASISFEVLTKSVEGSSRIMKELRDLAKSTPIAFSDFAQASKMLLGTRVAADQIKPTLSALAAISLGNTETFAGLAKAFSDVSAAGRLTGQEMLQFRNAGFNPLNEIARTTGKSMRELKKDMEDGKISFDMLSGSIQSSVSAGGLFQGMNERLMKTIQGEFNQLKNTFEELQITLGTQLFPTIKEVTNLIREMLNPSDPGLLGRILNDFSFGLGAIAAGLRDGSDGVKKFLSSWEENYIKASMARFKQNFAVKKDAKELGQQNKEITDEEIKQIKQKEDTYKDSIKKITEENIKARVFNPYDLGAFEKYMLRQDLFGKTLAQRFETEMAVITMSQTLHREEVNAALQRTKEMKTVLDIEERIAELKKTETTLSKDQLRDYATIENMFNRQIEQEKKSHEETKRLLIEQKDAGMFHEKGQKIHDEFRKFSEKMDQENERHTKRMSELRKAMDDSVTDVLSKAKLALKQTAEELTKKFDFKEAFKTQVEQLDFMLQQGMITQKVFDKAAIELGQQARSAMELLPNIAPALKEGSAEAYKFMLQQNQKSQEREAAKKMSQSILDQLREGNKLARLAPRLAKVR